MRDTTSSELNVKLMVDSPSFYLYIVIPSTVSSYRRNSSIIIIKG